MFHGLVQVLDDCGDGLPHGVPGQQGLRLQLRYPGHGLLRVGLKMVVLSFFHNLVVNGRTAKTIQPNTARRKDESHGRRKEI